MPATDKFSSTAPTPSSPARRAVAVTPHDTNELGVVAKYLYVGTGGHVTFVTVDGDTVTHKNQPSGGYVWAPVRQVKNTGTSAGDIVAHFD